MSAAARRDLRALARLWDVQLRFQDVFGERREASDEALIGVLGALGAPLERLDEATSALRARERQLAGRLCEPVAVAWTGMRHSLAVRVPARAGDDPITVVVQTEDGQERVVRKDGGAQPTTTEVLDGGMYLTTHVLLPDDLPHGYHHAVVSAAGREQAATIIGAPERPDDPRRKERGWGVFMPAYALRSLRSWGAGDLTDLRDLLRFVGERGGSLVATLPLLAAFLDDEPFEPSPYSPVSRLFWNELLIDIEAIPELSASSDARALIASNEYVSALGKLRARDSVDYARVYELKRRVLSILAQEAFTQNGARRAGLEDQDGASSQAAEYARFRAATAKAGPWTSWGDVTRLAEGDNAMYRLHRYAQAIAAEQIATLDDENATLLFDLPLGVHPLGYDAWRFRDSFAAKASGGAPPDTFFTKGQNWAFAPLHPERIRETAYTYP
ncbi:MAG TPA: 4-alpha-glucanotransferase, partial [Actinomycetota bacterium]|nr:4-alpha-glucanotransferase [Actinomycetota bacterium]